MRVAWDKRKTFWLAALVAVFALGLFWFGPVPAAWLGGSSLQTETAAASVADLPGADVDLVSPLTVYGTPSMLTEPGWTVLGRTGGAARAAAGLGTGEPAVGTLGFRAVERPEEPLRPGEAAAGAVREGWIRGGRMVRAAQPGELGDEAIRRTLGRKRGALEACYWNARTQDPTLVGDATFLVTVKPAGDVSVQVDQASARLAQAGVTSCIKERLEALDFSRTPPQGGDVSLRLPMSFLEP
jgi:hypothetical protein